MSEKSYSMIADQIIALYKRIKNKSLKLNVIMNYAEVIRGFSRAILDGEYKPSNECLYSILMLALDQYAYGNDGEVIMPDRMYDELHQIFMKRGHPQIIYPDVFETQWRIVKHNAPYMVGSVRKVYRFNDMYDFIDEECARYNLPCQNIIWMVAPKFDGISACLEIRKHSLVQAITRGTRTEGQDITQVVARAQNLVNILKECDTGFLKVELCVPQSNFEVLKKKGYKNRRSATSAIVNSPKNIELAQYIHAVPLVWVEEKNNSLRINYNPPTSKKLTGATANDIIQEMQELIVFLKDPQYEYEYRTDGVILWTYPSDGSNFDDIMEHSMAFKVNTAEAFTKVKRIYLTVGRTGKATPMLEVEPCEVNETVVTDVSLGSMPIYRRLGLHEGEEVIIYSAGDVIPQMRLPEERIYPKNAEIIELDEVCPHCGKPLHDDRCTNVYCPIKQSGRILNFIEKTAITKDISEKTIQDLYDAKFVRKIPDLFKLSIEQISSLDGYTEYSATKIIDELNKLRAAPMNESTLLGSIGCPGVSIKTASLILEYFTMDELMQMSGWNRSVLLNSIRGIGPEISKCLAKFIDEHGEEIEELREILNIEKDKSYIGSVVFSGFRDPKWEDKFDRIGFQSSESVSNRTTLCVVANYGTTKAKNALKKRIPIFLQTELDKAYKYALEYSKEAGYLDE